MPQIVLSWDEPPNESDPPVRIEIHNANGSTAVPAEACGFRLGLPNQVWSEAWFFATPGGLGEPFSQGGIVYASDGPGVPFPSEDAIVARGPVGACLDDQEASYDFETPLGSLGIGGDAPVVAGAGSFVADFTDEGDIEWLDSAGSVLEKPESPPPLEPMDLPPEFFEQPPENKVCIRDFELHLHCQDAEAQDGAAAQAGGTPGLTAAPSAIAPGAGVIPRIRTIRAPSGGESRTAREKVQAACPTELTLTATFFKAPDFEAAWVVYRFRFSHGPVSTNFLTLVDADEKSVHHAVPIPLPAPIGDDGGGGGVTPGADGFVVTPPTDPGGLLPSGDPVFVAPQVPANEHKGSVRVEVANVTDVDVVSGWTPYHVVCVSPARRTLRRGSRGALVDELQRRLNRWLRSREATPLAVNGRFGAKTESAVRTFQRAGGLAIDGIVGPRTWERLLAL